ncbi:MAG TPA: aldo/keto reductase [Friedmanniella sp.]
MTGASITAAPGGTFPLAGRAVPRLGYGMGQVTRSAQTAEAHAAAVALLRQAYDLGVRHFDTAEFYSHGLANRLLAEAFGSVRDEVTLATKAGARPVSGASVPLTAAQQPHELREAVEANLASLRTDRLDVVNLRRMDFRPGLLAEGDQAVALDDQLAELAALRDEGKIIGIGLSHVTLEQLETALPVGVTCVQNIYHLLDRTDEPLIAVCRDSSAAWVPYFPLGGGGEYAGLPKVVDDDVVQAVADEIGATPTQVGLAWQLAHAPNTMIITGTSSPGHLIENIASGDLVLDRPTMARLDHGAGQDGRDG